VQIADNVLQAEKKREEQMAERVERLREKDEQAKKVRTFGATRGEIDTVMCVAADSDCGGNMAVPFP